jgi:CDP-2,3-bis-(O-geranylgeranyl)-sn-glycerol synthase
MNDILTLIWLFLPAGIANMGPVIANNISFLKKYNQPLDFGKTFRGKRIFGDHKTIRGILAGGFMGLIVAFGQMLLSDIFSWLDRYSYQLDYSSSRILLFGLCLGFGAIIGDAVKSFFKRQIGVEPGKPWVPFDQLDFIIGGAIASLFFFTLPTHLYFLGFFLTLILHPTFNILSWVFRLQDKPF